MRRFQEATQASQLRRVRVVFGLLTWLALPLLLAGCQPTQVETPIVAGLGPDGPEAQLDFWHTLAGAPVTSNDDALHGLLLFLDEADAAPDYASRVAALQERGLLPARFDQPATQAVDRGTLAVVLVKVLKIRGGVVMGLTGASPRYAVKELQFLDVYPPSSPNQTFSGSEFLGIIGKVEDYQRVARAGAARPLQSIESDAPDPAAAEAPTP